MSRQRRKNMCTDFDNRYRREGCPRVARRPEELIATCCGECNNPCPKRCRKDLMRRFKDQEPADMHFWTHKKWRTWCLNVNEFLRQHPGYSHADYGPVENPVAAINPKTGGLPFLPDSKICEYCDPVKTKDRRCIKNDSITS